MKKLKLYKVLVNNRSCNGGDTVWEKGVWFEWMSNKNRHNNHKNSEVEDE